AGLAHTSGDPENVHGLMHAPLILDCCDAGIKVQPRERCEEFGDRVSRTGEEVRSTGAVAAPKPGDARPPDGAGEVALTVPVGCGGDDGGRRKVRVKEEVVDVPPGRTVPAAGEPQVPPHPGKPPAPPSRP